MRNMGLVKLALAGIVLSNLGQAQQAQPAQTQPAQKGQQHATQLEVGNVPTSNDMYCSGYITTESVPDRIYVAAGHNSPDQSRFAGVSDTVFLHGTGIKQGERYQIVRQVKDTNHYEIFRGQRSAVRNAGKPYFELAIVRVTDVQKDTAVAAFDLSCADVMPGDIAIPLVERDAPPFRNVVLDRYAPPSGQPQGRIIMAKEFDSFLGSKYKAYLSIGADKGLKPGDYLRATRTYSYTYRDPEAGLSLKASQYEDTQAHPKTLPRGDVSSLPRRTLGDMIVLQVHPKSATAMVLTALEGIQVGDGVELIDTSEAPVLPPIRPSFSNAPQPDAINATTTPPRITCAAAPTSLRAGENSTISCEAVSPDNRPVNITYVANGGKLSSNRNQATLDTTDTGPGPIAVRATAFDDRQLSASTVVTVNVEAPPAATAPTAQKLMELEYKTNSGYVDNRSKAVLDDVALKLQQDPNLTAVLSGSAEAGEPPHMALQRAQNAMAYLTKSKGIDPQRIQVKAGSEPGRKVEVWTLPSGATLPGTTPPAATPQSAPPQPEGDSQRPMPVPQPTPPLQ
jgi:hypothetical protein